MKTKRLFTILSMLISFAIVAQERDSKEMEPFEIENESIKKSTKDLRDVFSKMFSTAQFVDKKESGVCKPEDLVGKISIDGLRSGDKNLAEQISSIKDAYLEYPQHLQDAPSREAAYSFDTRNYKSMEDGALSSFGNTTNFADFVKVYTGGDVGDLNEFDTRTVRGQYDRLKSNQGVEFYIETESFMSLSCSHKETSYIKLKKLNYPNATWQIRTVVSADCDCSISSELTKNIKSGSVEYTAETIGLLTTTVITFGKVTNAKVKVKSLVCCPVKEEETKTALKEETNPFLDPAVANGDKKYVNTSWGNGKGTNDSKGYFQVGAYVGLPLGEEAEFYSLTYGAEAAYLFNLSENFSAGTGIGYMRFTGKDVGGFETEGVGFIPIKGLGSYNLSDDFDVYVYGGYSLSTVEDIDGGLNYGFGVGWRPVPGLIIRPEISFTNLGEDGNFDAFMVGVRRSF